MTAADRMRALGMAIALVVAASAGACSAGDVELNGSVFDSLGVGSKTQTARDTKVPERHGLVLPPNLERLPEPGSGNGGAPPVTTAFPVDPEQRRIANASQAEAQHRAHCEKALRKAKLENDLSPVIGPMGRCGGSVLDMINIATPVDIDAGGTGQKKR